MLFIAAKIGACVCQCDIGQMWLEKDRITGRWVVPAASQHTYLATAGARFGGELVEWNVYE